MPGINYFYVKNIKYHLPLTGFPSEIKKWKYLNGLLKDVSSKELLEPEIKQEPIVNLMYYSSILQDPDSIGMAFYDAIKVIQGYINADDSEVYLTTDDGRIYRFLRREDCQTHGIKWTMGPGTTIAAYIAFKRKPQIIENAGMFHANHPLGTGQADKDAQPNHVMVLPAITKRKELIAILEFRRYSESPFTETELNIASCLIDWMSQSVKDMDVFWNHARNKEVYNSWLMNFSNFLRQKEDPDDYLSTALIYLREVTQAQRLHYYKVIPSTNIHLHKYIEGIGENVMLRQIQEVKLEETDFLYVVLKEFETINLREELIKELGLPVPENMQPFTSYMAVPIGNQNNPHGLIEVINKKGGKEFTRKDERYSQDCGVFCAAMLHYDQLRQTRERTYKMSENHRETLLYHLGPCMHDLDLLTDEIDVPIGKQFYQALWYPREHEKIYLLHYIWSMFKEIFNPTLAETKNIKMYILYAKRGYRDNPYHNFEHAFNVTHCMFIFLRNNRTLFSDLEKKALLAACLCHDIDHPGLSNKFLEHSESYLTSLYTQSFLENHHSCLARMLEQHCKLFSDMDPISYRKAIREMDSAIMATDLSSYFTCRYQLMELLTTDTFCLKTEKHKKLIKELLMTACDLSGNCKDFDIVEKLCRDLHKEFFAEADRDLVLGYKPIIVMDRTNKSLIPKYQLHFLSEVVIPCFYILSIIIPTAKDLHNQSCEVWTIWDTIYSSGYPWEVDGTKPTQLEAEYRQYVS